MKESHQVKEGVAPSKEKIAAVVNAQAVKNVSEVRSFVHLFSTRQSSSPTFYKWQSLYGSHLGRDSPLSEVVNSNL